MPSDQTNPIDNYRSVRHELLQYEQALGDRPEIVVVTKMELPDAEMVRTELTQTLDKEVLGISAVTGAGLDRLMQTILLHLQREAVA